jgi:hypothetical protein
LDASSVTDSYFYLTRRLGQRFLNRDHAKNKKALQVTGRQWRFFIHLQSKKIPTECGPRMLQRPNKSDFAELYIEEQFWIAWSRVAKGTVQ